jgi:hypothetical protein
MSYGLMFWGNSSHADIVFKLQKRVVRPMLGCGYRESCIVWHCIVFIFNLEIITKRYWTRQRRKICRKKREKEGEHIVTLE